jgi:hypothetical protein
MPTLTLAWPTLPLLLPVTACDTTAFANKSSYRKMSRTELLKLKLRTSPLPPLFHLRDLEGQGRLRRFATPAGDIFRLPAV